MRCVPQPSSGEVHLRTVVVFSSSEGGPSGRRLTASISQTSASTSVGKAAATLPVQSCVSSTERSRPSLRMSPSADSGPAGFSKCCSLSTVDTTRCTGSLESTANMRALSGRTSVTCGARVRAAICMCVACIRALLVAWTCCSLRFSGGLEAVGLLGSSTRVFSRRARRAAHSEGAQLSPSKTGDAM